MVTTSSLGCIPQPDYEQDIEKIVHELMVKGQKIVLKGAPGNNDMRRDMLELGIDRLDTFMLLSNYIYRHYYVKATHFRPSTMGRIYILPPQKKTVDGVTYEDIDPSCNDYWIDSYWQYAPGLINNQDKSSLILRRGTEATWVRNGSYAEYSTETDDESPLLTTNVPTHTFVKGAPTASYNWIFGKYRHENDSSGYVRFYFNLKPSCEAAAKLSSAIRRNFDLYQIPFTFKFLAFSEDYKGRCDTAVLYLERRYLLPASYLIRDIYYNVIFSENPNESLVFDGACMFIKPLLEGLSFGEDPENSDSFGTSRCKAIARILMHDAEGISDKGQRFNKVLDSLKNEGYNSTDFYRNPNSKINYQFYFDIITGDGSSQISNYRQIRVLQPDEADWFGQPGKQKYLRAAVSIAIRLCKEAIWYDGTNNEKHCNWLTYMAITNQSKFGYTYQFMPTSGLEFESAIGIKVFLELIYNNYYDADLILKTADGVVFQPSVAKPDFPKKEWYDEEIKRAWEMTFGTLKNVDQKIKEELADLIIAKFQEENRPFGNGFTNNDWYRRRLFCPNVKHGLAGLGYFFLSVYDFKTPLPDQNK